METKEACDLINETYVLTEREKSRFIGMIQAGNPTLTEILKRYKKEKNVHEFYDELKKNQLLSSQILKSNTQNKPKTGQRAPQGAQRSSPRRQSPLKNQVAEIQKLLSLVPLHRVPLHIILKELCGGGRGACNLDKFRAVLPRLLPDCKNCRDGKILMNMYNLLDSNHDGNIDVNELSNGMIVFHPPMTYKQDADFWAKISKVNWIPQQRCVDNLKKLGLDEREIQRNLAGINLEGTPNLTFSQFLRAKATPSRVNLESMFKEGVSRSPNSAKSGSSGLSPGGIHQISIIRPNNQNNPHARFMNGHGSPSTPEHFPGDVKRRKQEVSFSDNDIRMMSPQKHKHHPIIIKPQIPMGRRGPPNLPTGPGVRKQGSPFFDQENRAKMPKPVFVHQARTSPFQNSPGSRVRLPNGQVLGSPFNKVKVNKFNGRSPSPLKVRPNLNLNQTGKQGIGMKPTFLKTKDVKSNGRLRHLISPGVSQASLSRSPTKHRQAYRPGGILQSTPLLPGTGPRYINTSTPRVHRPLSPVVGRYSPPQPGYCQPVPGCCGTGGRGGPKVNRLARGQNRSPSPFNHGQTNRGKPVVIRGNLKNSVSPNRERTPSPHYYMPGRRGDQQTLVKGAYRYNGSGRKPYVRVINPQVVVKKRIGDIDSAKKMKNFNDLRFHPEQKGKKGFDSNSKYAKGGSNLKYAKGGSNQKKGKNEEIISPKKKLDESRITYSPPKIIPPAMGSLDNQSTAKKEDLRKNSKKDINSTNSSQTSPFEHSKKQKANEPNETGGKMLQSSFSKIPEMKKKTEESSSEEEVPGYFDRSKLLKRKPRESNPIGKEQKIKLQQIPKAQVVQSETVIPNPNKRQQSSNINKPRFQTIGGNNQLNRGQSLPQTFNNRFSANPPKTGQNQFNRQNTQNRQNSKNQGGALNFHKNKNQNRVKFSTPVIAPQKAFNPNSTLATLISSRIPLGLHNISCLEFSSFLRSYLKRQKSKSLNFKNFKEMMNICKPLDIDEDIYMENLQKLFRLIDSNQNGRADRTELANILILLTNGSKADKIKAAFNFYDVNRNGTLDRTELTDYFTGVLKLKWRDSPELAHLKEDQIKLVAASPAKSCFDNIDQDQSGQISLKEFTEWVLNGGQVLQTERIRKSHFNDFHRKYELNNSKETIDKIRDGVPFQKIHISIACHLLNKETADIKAMDKTRFKKYLKRLVSKTSTEVKFSDTFDNIPALFFNIFDYSNNGILDKEELGVGLFLLCGKFTKINSFFTFSSQRKLLFFTPNIFFYNQNFFSSKFNFF